HRAAGGRVRRARPADDRGLSAARHRNLSPSMQPQRRSNVQTSPIKYLAGLVSLLVGVVVCEAGGRLLLNPADYLSVSTTADPVLGMTIQPRSGGFDEWGFRNRNVPRTVDVLALGDSHTFGNTARMRESWPQVVAQKTGQSVYN